MTVHFEASSGLKQHQQIASHNISILDPLSVDVKSSGPVNYFVCQQHIFIFIFESFQKNFIFYYIDIID